MTTLEIKKELGDLLENAQSVLSLDPIKRGTLKHKLLSLPDREMRQAIEQLKDERKKMAAVAGEIVKMSAEARNESRTLHALMLNEQRLGEARESGKQSEQVLQRLKGAKTGWLRFSVPAIYFVLGACAVLLLLKYFNYF